MVKFKPLIGHADVPDSHLGCVKLNGIELRAQRDERDRRFALAGFRFIIDIESETVVNDVILLRAHKMFSRDRFILAEEGATARCQQSRYKNVFHTDMGFGIVERWR